MQRIVEARDKPAILERLAAGQTRRSIAVAYGVTHQTLAYHLRRWGVPPVRVNAVNGEQHASWRGGSFVDRWGYKMVRAPQRMKAGMYCPEHLLVAEASIGRQLVQGKEVVHHIDGDKSNNTPGNLLVCTRSQHRVLHRSLEQIGYILVARGLVVFEGGEYRLR
jgi:hypothetical protein